MSAVLDQAGVPATLALDVYRSESISSTDGKVDPERLAGSMPVVTLSADPERVLRGHVREFELFLAQKRPDLGGQDSPVALELVGDGPLKVPVLVAREGDAATPWGERPVLALYPVDLRTLDRAPITPALQRRGLEPSDHVFIVRTQGLAPAPTTNGRRGLFGARPGRDTPVVLTPPAYPRTLPPEAWTDLDPSLAHPDDLPIYVDEHLVRRLVDEEARFVAETPPERWIERCSFLYGRLRADIEGRPFGAIAATGRATEVDAGPAHLEFSPATWEAMAAERDEAGLTLLGHVHTHRMSSIALLHPEEASAEQPVPEPRPLRASVETTEERDAVEHDPEEPAEREPANGLFLSGMDRDSAMRGGFRFAAATLAVIDSDGAEAVRSGEAPLSHAFGVWGWAGGSLVRRSVRLVNPQDEGATSPANNERN